MKTRIILENGMELEGTSVGEINDTFCELVFDTSMAGYEEVLTNAKYKNRGVVMTYPTIGNYGITDDCKNSNVELNCLIVNEFAREGSNFRKKQDIIPYLKEKKVAAVYGVDTRMLTKIIRDNKKVYGLITNNEYSIKEGLEKIDEYRMEVILQKCLETVK